VTWTVGSTLENPDDDRHRRDQRQRQLGGERHHRYAAANTLKGFGGNDTLIGGAGNDRLGRR